MTPRTLRVAAAVTAAVGAVGGGGCGDGPAATVAAPGVAPVGFATAEVTVTSPEGTICRRCMWLAARADQRARGLMGVTDLGGAGGMVFVYDTPRPVSYWMRSTPMALSISFFGGDGAFVGAADLAPCGATGACPSHPSGGPAAVVVEVPTDARDELGAVPGSHVEVGGPCVLAAGPASTQ